MAKKYYDGENMFSESVGGGALFPKEPMKKKFENKNDYKYDKKVYGDTMESIDQQIKDDNKYRKGK